MAKLELIVSFKQQDESEVALHARIKKQRNYSAFMKDAAAEKFEREDEKEAALQNRNGAIRKSIQPPKGFDV